MIAGIALFLVLVPQDPAVGAEDIVRLKVGTELVGRILEETADYLEMELSDGSIVGFDKARTSAILRAASAPRAEVAAPRAKFAPRDRWNVLHDADGRTVGWMHSTVAVTEEGETRFGEEWRFVDGDRSVETTVLEVIGTDGEPRRAFCHERIRRAGDQLSGERLVDAVADAGRLTVMRRSNRGSERQVYDFAPGTRFPLELREELRTRPAGAQSRETHDVYDPLLEQFASRIFDVGRTRRVDLGGGKIAHVRLLEATASGGLENTEWLDASSQPVRSEIAGPALVAVPVTDRGEAQRRVHAASVAFQPAFRAEPSGTFGLWLPSPVWTFVEPERDGEITAISELDDASITLMQMTQLEPNLGLASATDTVLRWLRLAHRKLDIVERRVDTIRGLPGERIRARAMRHDGADVELLVHVLRRGEKWFASCSSVPRVAFARVEPDLDWMIERFELEREGFAPTPQGPFAARRR